MSCNCCGVNAGAGDGCGGGFVLLGAVGSVRSKSLAVTTRSIRTASATTWPLARLVSCTTSELPLMVNVPSDCHWTFPCPFFWLRGMPFWFTRTVPRSVVPSNTENGAFLAYDGDLGEVIDTR